MNVTLNNIRMNVEEDIDLYTLLDTQAFPDQGIAVAMNGCVIPSAAWQQTHLTDGDNIDVFFAIAGG